MNGYTICIQNCIQVSAACVIRYLRKPEDFQKSILICRKPLFIDPIAVIVHVFPHIQNFRGILITRYIYMKIQFLNGGLANQAFQYIFAKYYELSHPGDAMYMDDTYFALNTVHNG